MAVDLDTQKQHVAEIFVAYMKRAPEFSAMNYYVDRYQELLADNDADAAFKLLSAEIYDTAATFGEVPAGPTVTDAEYVAWLYQNILGRPGDVAGLSYWETQLESGALERSEMVAVFVNAAREHEDDAAYINNRTQVALEFARFANSNDNILSTLEFDAGAVLAGVTADPASVEAALNKMVDATHGGQSFNLTSNVDKLLGTAGDDTFNAFPETTVWGGETSTLGRYDQIDGGQGTDTLNIHASAGINDEQVGAVKNVEIINIHNEGGLFRNADGVVDAAKFEGAQEIWQIGAATNVVGLQDGGLVGLRDLQTNIHTNWRIIEAAADAVTARIALDNVTSPEGLYLDVRGDALESVTASGAFADAETLLELDVTAGKTITSLAIESAFNTWLYLRGDALTSLDASASTGDISVRLAGNVRNAVTSSGDDLVIFAQNNAKAAAIATGDGDDVIELEKRGAGKLTIDAGAGDDVIMLYTGLRATDVIDGGEGEDRVGTYIEGALTDTDYTLLNGVIRNVEQLSFAEVVTVNAARLDNFSTLIFGRDADEPAAVSTVANATAAQELIARGDLTVSAKGYSVAGASTTYGDAVTVTALGDDSDITVNAGSVNLTVSAADTDYDDDDTAEGVEVTLKGDLKIADVVLVNGVDSESDPTADTIARLWVETDVLPALTTLTLSGDGTAYVFNHVGGNLVTVDASELSGVYGYAADDHAKGDAIDGLVYVSFNKDVAETIILGAGNDRVMLTGSTFETLDTVTGLDLDADKLMILGLQEAEVAIAEVDSGINTLELALVYMAGQDDMNVAFHFGGDTYVYSSEDSVFDHDDVLVKLTGTLDLDLLTHELNSYFLS